MMKGPNLTYVPDEVRELIIFHVIGFHKAYHKAVNAELAGRGLEIQFEQMPPLMILYVMNRSATQQELANELNRDKSSILRSVQSLAKLGFVEISQDEQDKRKNMIQITPAGVQVAKAVIARGTQLNEKIIRDVSKEEMDTFIKVINQMRTNCEQIVSNI